jgi:hypothetical protein
MVGMAVRFMCLLTSLSVLLLKFDRSSPTKVDCDLQLTLMASSLYRLLALKVKNGYLRAHSRHLFRDFIEATAFVTIDESGIDVHFQKRAHNPLLLAAGFHQTQQRIPWLANKRLNLYFG